MHDDRDQTIIELKARLYDVEHELQTNNNVLMGVAAMVGGLNEQGQIDSDAIFKALVPIAEANKEGSES